MKTPSLWPLATMPCAYLSTILSTPMWQKLYQLGVKVIALRCAGFNNVDLRACQGKLPVYRVPAYSPYAVAEHAMALLLTINRRTHKAYIRTRDFNFSLQGLAGFDLHGKTVGIIGTGKIGRVFADICKGFGMHILAYDKFPAPDSGLTYVDLPELFEKSDDYLPPLPSDGRNQAPDQCRLHCPHEKGRDHPQHLPRCLDANTEDLITGIKDKQVGAACLDVYEEEGDFFYEDYSGHIVRDDKLVRLISMPNVIVTSHQAFLTNEALDAIASTTVDNLRCFFQGHPNKTTEVRCQ